MMQIQEPEQRRQAGFEEQPSWESPEYRDDYARRYEQEQRQKLFFQSQPKRDRKPLWIVTLILSSIGFYLTSATAALLVTVLVQDHNYSDFSWQEPRVAETTIGLISTILVMLLCGTIAILAVVVLSRRIRR
jgi:hypothetical protein